MTEDLEDWLALLRAPGLSPDSLRRLLSSEGDAAAARRSSATKLQAAGAPPDAVAALRSPDARRLAQDLAWLQAPGQRLLTCLDADFPARLQDAAGAPAALWLRGKPAALASPQLAVVGSRNPTHTGRETAHAFAACLAEKGLTIVSGLAAGIDTAAHEGALAAGGETVAVLGCGIDGCYPRANAGLLGRIAAHDGAVISEYPPGTPPAKWHFPARNRIIAALSVGVLVVEASRQSGSLITARLAGELGREVFAIPGSIHNPLARGCHLLIRQGAKLVETADDVLVELAESLAPWLRDTPPPAPTETASGATEVDEEYLKLLNALEFSPASIDQLRIRTGLTTQILSSMLLVLELDGTVELLPGGVYARVHQTR